MKPTRVDIPDQLKSGLPQTTFGKILSATPVVMAVVATMLAGLASSEMTKAQYVRSLGAQQQSKAGDQWSFFQAKRVRSAIQLNTAELMQSLADVSPLNAATFIQQVEKSPASAQKEKTLALAQSDNGRFALALLGKGQLPPYPKSTAIDPAIQAAIEGIENSAPDDEMRAMLAKVDNGQVEEALKDAREQVKSLDAATEPVNRAIEQLNDLLEQGTSATASPGLFRAFTAARLRYTANRYELEARLNQVIANLYEVQVRKSNLEAEHRHQRSERFFFGMLAAQAAVIISTFAMAARNRNLLWSLAAAAGIVAVGFAIYVYLYT
jgi:hypothetical protein